MIPEKPLLLIPRVSSENREYIPMAYVKPHSIPSDSTTIIDNASVELFGLLTSNMHMVWMKTFGGKLETRYRYFAGMVYNIFPVPDDYKSLKPFARKILDIRDNYKNSTLADLYDPETMPSDLYTAHKKLDRAVEKLYRAKLFEFDSERITFLLEKYAMMLKTE